MPYFSDDIIEEVRSRNDIVDVIGQYVHLRKKGAPILDCVLFIMRKTGSFFCFSEINKCTTASAVEPEGMFSHL